MPPKVRELMILLEKYGFADRGGKGSHRVYYHPKYSRVVTILGKVGADAPKYQIKEVREAIDAIKK